MEHVREFALGHPYSKTFIFVPSDAKSLMNDDMMNPDSKQEPCPSRYGFKHEEVVGFPANEDITLIRLTGPENETHKWRPASAIREMSTTLGQALAMEGYSVVDHECEQRLPQRNGVALPSRDLRSVEWKAVERQALAAGEARSTIDFKEIVLRIENAIGLYETRSGMA